MMRKMFDAIFPFSLHVIKDTKLRAWLVYGRFLLKIKDI